MLLYVVGLHCILVICKKAVSVKYALFREICDIKFSDRYFVILIFKNIRFYYTPDGAHPLLEASECKREIFLNMEALSFFRLFVFMF